MKRFVILFAGVFTVFSCGGELPGSGDLVVNTVLDHNTVLAGNSTNVKCVVHDVYGNEVQAATDVLFQTPEGVKAPTVDKGDFVLTKSGVYKVACELSETKIMDPTPEKLTVMPGAPVRTVTTVNPDQVGAGDVAQATCTALDKYDNPIPDAKVVLDTVKDLDIEGMQVSSKVPGDYDLTCSVQEVTVDDKTPAKLTVTAGKPVRVELTAKPKKAVYNLHNKVTLTYTVYDEYDNVVPGIKGEITPPANNIDDLGNDMYQFMAEGTYTFTVTLNDPYSDITGSLVLICDMGPPEITITNPPRGMTYDGKPSLNVEGTVTDAGSGVKWVKVNGNDVRLDENGAFSFLMTSVHGLNPVLVEAMDNVKNKSKLTRGYYYSTNYIHFADDTPIDDVIISDAGMLYMGQNALDDGNHDPSDINDLATIVEVLLGDIDYNQLLGQLPPMRYSIPLNITLPGLNFLGVTLGLTGDLTLSAKITDLQFGKPHVDLKLEDGGIDTKITLQPITISIEINAQINAFAGITLKNGKQYGANISPGGTTATSATIGKLLVHTEIMISKKPTDAKISFELKNFHVETQDIDVQPITKFVINLGDIVIANQTIHLGQIDLTQSIGGFSKLISDNLLNPLLNNSLIPKISTFLEPVVNKVLTLALDQLINMLVIDQKINIPLGPLGNLPLHFKTSLSTADFTKDAATIGLNLGTLTKKVVDRDPLGTILRAGCMSRNGEQPFKFHKDPSIQLSGRYDFINELLFTVWWSGLINQKLDLGKLGGGTGGGTGGMNLSGTVITPNLLLPPILDDCNADGAQEIQVGDMYLDLNLNMSGFKAHIGMWVQADADAEIIAHDNEIGIKINKVKNIETEIIDLGGLGKLKGIIDSLVPSLIHQIEGKELTFPIPPIDIGGLIPGLPAGTQLQLGNMSAYHEHGFGTVGGDLQ